MDGSPLAPGTPKVVILGAGFGGLTAARSLKNADVEITLIDRQNYHLFQPCLFYTSPSPRDRQESRLPSSS